MRVVWLRRALTDINAIDAYIERDDPAAARRVQQRIKEAVSLLEQRPHIGRPGRVSETRELVVPDTPYIVPYAVIGSEIVILAVIHTARRWPDSL
jgi:toxin ParE1/3/4